MIEPGKINRRGFLAGIASLLAMSAVPALAFLPTVEDYGATGTPDDSGTFDAMLSAEGYIRTKPAKIYNVKDLVIGSGQSLICDGSRLRPAAGAKWIVRTTGWKPRLIDVEFEDVNDVVAPLRVLAAGAAAGANTITLASAAGCEVGQWIAVRMDDRTPHGTFIDAVAGNVVTLRRAMRGAASAGQYVVASWGMVSDYESQFAEARNLTFVNTSVGIVAVDGGSVCLQGRWLFDMRDVKFAGLVEGSDVADMVHTGRIRGGHVEQRAYTGDGVTKDFGTWWPIFLRRDVTATVNGVPQTLTVLNPWTVRFAVAPPAGAAIAISNFTDGWFGYFNDQKGWSVIRGGSNYRGMEILDFIFGHYIYEKMLANFTEITIDTCQYGIFARDCPDLNYGFSEDSYGFQQVNAENSKLRFATRSKFTFADPAQLVVPSGSALYLGAGAVMTIDAAGLTSDSVITKTGPGVLNLV